MLGVSDHSRNVSLEDMLRDWQLEKKPTNASVSDPAHRRVDVGDGIFSIGHKKCGDLVVPVTGRWVSKEPHLKVTGSSNSSESSQSSSCRNGESSISNRGLYVIHFTGKDRKNWAFEMDRRTPAYYINTDKIANYTQYKEANCYMQDDQWDWEDFYTGTDKLRGEGNLYYMNIFAKRDLQPGEECIISYGNAFSQVSRVCVCLCLNISPSLFDYLNYTV